MRVLREELVVDELPGGAGVRGGQDHGSGGLFGYLTAVSTDLTEGNAQ
jgi:hypothetical protein